MAEQNHRDPDLAESLDDRGESPEPLLPGEFPRSPGTSGRRWQRTGARY